MPKIEEVISLVRAEGYEAEDRDGVLVLLNPIGLSATDIEEMLHRIGWNRSWGYIRPPKSADSGNKRK